MIETYLLLRILLETAELLSVEMIYNDLSIPVLSCTMIPDKNLTIDDIGISPIDDHMTYGVAQ